MQTQFILVRPRPVPTSSPQATRLKFPLSCKILLQSLNHTRTTLPLCSDHFATRDPRSLNHFSWVRKKRRTIISSKRKIVQWSTQIIPYWITSVLVKEFLEDKTIWFIFYWENKNFWSVKNPKKFVSHVTNL